MTAFKRIAENDKTVTLSRRDFQALVAAAENAIDLSAVQAHRAHEERIGWQTARRSYLTGQDARRILDGESPVRVWREARGLSQRALAEAAKIAPSYLAEIESGKKSGRPETLERIGSALEVPWTDLVIAPATSATLSPVTRADKAAEQLLAFAEAGASVADMQAKVRSIVSRWRREADRAGVGNHLRAANGVLQDTLARLQQWHQIARDQDRISPTGAAAKVETVSAAIDVALTTLAEEYRKL